MVSIFDSRWAQLVCQQIAPLQVLYAEASINYLPSSSPYCAQISDRWISEFEPLPDTVPWFILPGVKHVFPPSSRSLTKPSILSKSTENLRSLLVLGGPHQLLSDAAHILHDCNNQNLFDKLIFLSDQWSSLHSVESWWNNSFENIPLPANIILDAFESSNVMNYHCLAVDLCIESNAYLALLCVFHGIPVVTYNNKEPSSRATLSLLSSLGHQALARTELEECMAVIEALATNKSTYHSFSNSLTDSFQKSLLVDYEQLGFGINEVIKLVS